MEITGNVFLVNSRKGCLADVTDKGRHLCARGELREFFVLKKINIVGAFLVGVTFCDDGYSHHGARKYSRKAETYDCMCPLQQGEKGDVKRAQIVVEDNGDLRFISADYRTTIVFHPYSVSQNGDGRLNVLRRILRRVFFKTPVI